MKCIVNEKRYPDHKWCLGKYGGKDVDFCMRCGAKRI